MPTRDSRRNQISTIDSFERLSYGHLQHPGIVRIHSLEEYERLPREGTSLAKVLAKKKRFAAHEAVEYMLQICAAVEYARGRGA